MRINIISIVFLLSIVTGTLYAQSDYNTFLKRGVEAAENFSFTSAEDIFKDARKHFRKLKDKARQVEFDNLVDKTRALKNAYGIVKSAERKAGGGDYREAHGSIISARSYLDKSKRKFHKSLVDVEEDVAALIDDASEEIAEDRLAFIDGRIRAGKNAMDRESYSLAISSFSSAKSAMINNSEESEYLIDALLSKAEAGQYITAGNNAYNRADYILAYRKYKLAADKGQHSAVASRMGECQRNICTSLDRSKENLSAISGEDLERDQKLAVECQCSSAIQSRYKAERARRESKTNQPASATTTQVTAPAVRKDLYVASRNVKKSTVSVKVTLEKISVDDHQEKMWGFVDCEIYDVSTNKKVKSTRLFSASKSTPITGYPSVLYQSYTHNVKRSITFEADEEKLRNRKYEVRYSLNLACGHKDNDFAAWGAHEMGRKAEGRILLSNKYYDTRVFEKSPMYKTQSNRRHDFQLHWVIMGTSKKS